MKSIKDEDAVERSAFNMVLTVLIRLLSISAVGYGMEAGGNGAPLGSEGFLQNPLLNGYQGVKCCQPSCCCIPTTHCSCCQPLPPSTPPPAPPPPPPPPSPEPCCCCCCSLPPLPPQTTTLPPPPPPVQTERIMCCQSPPIMIQPPPFYYKQIITCNTENVPIKAPCEGKCNVASGCSCCCDCNTGMRNHGEISAHGGSSMPGTHGSSSMPGALGGMSIPQNSHAPSMVAPHLSNMPHQNPMDGHGGMGGPSSMVNQNVMGGHNPMTSPGIVSQNPMSGHNGVGASGSSGMTGHVRMFSPNHMANPNGVIEPVGMIGQNYMSQPMGNPNSMSGYQHGSNPISRLTGFRNMRKLVTDNNSPSTLRKLSENEELKPSLNNEAYYQLKKMPAFIVEYSN